MENVILCKCTDCRLTFYSELINGNKCPIVTCYGEVEIIDGEEFLEDC